MQPISVKQPVVHVLKNGQFIDVRRAAISCYGTTSLALGRVTTLAGGYLEGHDDGYGTKAHFFHPTGLAFDSERKIIYVTDQVFEASYVNIHCAIYPRNYGAHLVLAEWNVVYKF